MDNMFLDGAGGVTSTRRNLSSLLKSKNPKAVFHHKTIIALIVPLVSPTLVYNPHVKREMLRALTVARGFIKRLAL